MTDPGTRVPTDPATAACRAALERWQWHQTLCRACRGGVACLLNRYLEREHNRAAFAQGMAEAALMVGG